MTINLPLLVVLLIVMTWFGAIGGYLLKKSSSCDFNKDRYRFLGWLAAGVSFYGAAAILNIIALRFLPYTIVFPLTAVTYIWTMIISYFILKENISIKKILGVALIVTGAVILVL